MLCLLSCHYKTCWKHAVAITYSNAHIFSSQVLHTLVPVLFSFLLQNTLSLSCHCEPAEGRRSNHILCCPHSLYLYSFTYTRIFVFVFFFYTYTCFSFFVIANTAPAVCGNLILCCPHLLLSLRAYRR